MVTIKEPPTSLEILHEMYCPHCNAVLEYTDEDIDTLIDGYGFECPYCHKDIVIEEYLTEPVFPKAFYHFGDSKNAVHILDNEIQEWVDAVYADLKNSKKDFDCNSIASGDSIVFGIKGEEGITIWVAKNYWEFNKFFDED